MSIPPRREFKYLLPPALLPALRAQLRGVADLDPHAGPDRTYLIRSLYLDTWDMRLYHANEREAPRRFKARIRTYPGDPSAPVFAEIKHRDGDIIAKTRASLPPDWQPILRGRVRGGSWEGPGFDEFMARMVRWDLRPVALVQYRREAWASAVDEYARVSIDFRVECRVQRDWSLSARDDWRPADSPLPTATVGSIGVLELKFADVVPRWMTALVQHLDLIRHSFSKYAYSMRALAEDHWMDYRRSEQAWA